MRILHVGKFFPPTHGGIERFVADLADAQGRQGHHVAVAYHVLVGDRNQAEKNSAILYPCHAFGSVLYAPLSPEFPFLLHRALKQFRPGLIHLHLPNPSAFWILFQPAARNIPWVVHWHCDVAIPARKHFLRLAYRVYRRFEQALLRKAAIVVCTSPDYLNASEPLRAWRSKCRILPLGMNPQRVRTGQHSNAHWPTQGLRVLALGRLAHYKGFNVLLDALRRVEAVQLVIIGAGEMASQLRGLITQNALSQRVTLLGQAKQSVVNSYLANCDVLCLPSITRAEAFGLTLLEAMVCAKPVVVSDVPGAGMGWVVRRGGHGLLASANDAASLARAINSMQDRDRRERLGQAGASAFIECFHIDQIARQLEEQAYRPALRQGTDS